MTTAPRADAEHTGVVRLRWLLAVFGLVFLISVGQLVRIQVIDAEAYASTSAAQRERTVDLAATRGRLYDREGDVLATSVTSATIYADPRAYEPGEGPDGEPVPAAGEPREVAARLADHLDLSAEHIEERLRRDAHFAYIARQVDWETGEAIRELGLPGIGVLEEPERVYPAGSLAAQVMGFTDIDGKGLQGLEVQHEELLHGRPGRLAVERDPSGITIASGVRELVPAEAGTDLVLTLDREIQHLAEQAAAAATEEHDALGAGVVVLDADQGEVLAMASAPTFDPNDRTGSEKEHWRNRPVTDVFEPGSTQKALTAAAAIEEGLVTPSTTMRVDDSITVGSKRFTDAHEHGVEQWSLAQVMERSSNVGTIQVAQELGAERLEGYLRDFGYGRALGTGFPGEASGLLTPHEEWWNTSLPTISIGHGVAVSLLQLGSAYATLANDGVSQQPRLLRGTVGEDGRLTPTRMPDAERVVSTDTARAVRSMLADAVNGEHGTGQRAQIPGYEVAGKTGTARKPRDGGRGYSSEYVATFAGMAPADDPELVVAVMLDEPQPYYGGVVAAPLFAEVMEGALTQLGVPPDTASESAGQALSAAERRAADAAAEVEPPADGDPAAPPAGDPAGQ